MHTVGWALFGDNLTNRTGSGHLEKTPNIVNATRTTANQKIADINIAMAQNAEAAFILGRCIHDPHHSVADRGHQLVRQPL